MRYSFQISRRFSYVRTYTIVKRVNEDTNVVTKFVQDLIDKYVVKGEK